MKETVVLCRVGVLLGLAALACGCTFELVDPPPSAEFALQTVHGRYVTALGAEKGWTLSQETDLSECGWFTLSYLANGRVTLKTCHERYIAAPPSGTKRSDWLIVQRLRQGRCGQSDLYELGSDRIAIKTCANRFVTPGDGNWPGALAWAVVGETEDLMEWEILTMVER
jgi:hypothetical protein